MISLSLSCFYGGHTYENVHFGIRSETQTFGFLYKSDYFKDSEARSRKGLNYLLSYTL